MNKIKQSLLSVVIGLALAAGVSYAWTGPTASPPSGNTDAPINVGSLTQYKSGTLGIGGLFRAYGQAIFDGNVGIGTASPEQKLDVAGNVKSNDVIFGGKSLSSCQICFHYFADGDAGQCNTGQGSQTFCAPIDSWTSSYRDDTDNRPGGCQMQWKIDCTPPYGD